MRLRVFHSLDPGQRPRWDNVLTLFDAFPSYGSFYFGRQANDDLFELCTKEAGMSATEIC